MSLPDKKALKILFDRYWTSQGWRDQMSRVTTAADFNYAKSAGIMFDDVALSHDDIVEQAIAALNAVSRKEVADAFVASLTSRRLEMRSALGSFVVLQHLPKHSWHALEYCPVCGEYHRPHEMVDLNVLNFERFKWGGVRLHSPLYAGFDLKRFRDAEVGKPTDADVALFKEIVAAIERAGDETKFGELHRALPKALPSNMFERNHLLSILGLCGVLGTNFHPKETRTFFHRWSHASAHQFEETDGPTAVNVQALRHWFGHLVKAKEDLA